MKIAVFLPNLSVAGPQIVAKDIIDGLLEIGNGEITVDVFYFFKEVYDTHTISFNVPVRQIGWDDAFDFAPYDIVHAHCIASDKFIYKNREKIKAICVSTVHNIIYDEFLYMKGRLWANIYPYIYMRYLRKMDKVVVLTNKMKNYYRRFIGASKMEVIPNGRNVILGEIALEDKRLLEQIRKKYKYIVGAPCWVTARKGLHQFVDILPRFPDTAFVVIGDGDAKEGLTQQAERLQVSGQCIFLGKKANGSDYFPYFDFYAMTSYSEGVSLSLLEAAANATPTLCSDIPQNREIFDDTEVAYFELDNVEAVAQAFEKLRRNATGFAQKMHSKYLTDYTGKIMAGRYMDLYTQLLQQTAAKR